MQHQDKHKHLEMTQRCQKVEEEMKSHHIYIRLTYNGKRLLLKFRGEEKAANKKKLMPVMCFSIWISILHVCNNKLYIVLC